jgi:chromosome partitioning protein
MTKRSVQGAVSKSNGVQSIAFANHKGGSGKTTSCLSIAGCLAKSGGKVLVVDFDPQANATSGLGVDKSTVRHSMYDAILTYCDGHQGVPITSVILETDVENLHVAPSEFDLAVAECHMFGSRDKTSLLTRVLAPIRSYYDYILIDLPPTSGLLTINGLCAADHVIVPVDPSIFSLETLDDLAKSFRDIKEITGHPLNQLGAVLIRYVRPSGRKRGSSQEVEAYLKKRFDTVFLVPADEEVYQTQKEGIPLSHSAPRSGAGRAYAKIAKVLQNSMMPPKAESTPRRRARG